MANKLQTHVTHPAFTDVQGDGPLAVLARSLELYGSTSKFLFLLKLLNFKLITHTHTFEHHTTA